MQLSAEMFRVEMAAALEAFNKYVVCLEKAPEDFEQSLNRLMEKAIKAYVNRGPNLRHGIALDKQVTVILSQTERDRPLCGIYFNLHSPYQKKPARRSADRT
jgi:predicted RNase H-like nuclease (RuvC/YqgF family)